MNIGERTLRSLEWDRLREFLAAEAVTAWGRDLCSNLKPERDFQAVESLLEESREALSLLDAGSPLVIETADLRETLSRVAVGADLSARQLVDVKEMLASSRRARAALALLKREHFPRLATFVERLHSADELVEAIDSAIDDSAEVKDSASDELESLRRQADHLEKQIRDELSKTIHAPAFSKYLQEPIFTQRNGRYVLPVSAAHRHEVKGIVHDSSASGLTVYIEPMTVVELANSLRLTESEIEREIARILSSLSRLCAANLGKIESAFRALVDLDCIMARVWLACKYGGTCPELSHGTEVRFREARHPLLVLQNPDRASQVVPNDIVLNRDQRTMIVTGPNTGGKTVLLKTAGLLSVMLRAGMPLPVASGSRSCVFPEIYADIGDEQSLEQSLSTFSSHMTNIIEIVDRAGPGSLVLLDEIGAGTDPREGAALARSILEHLNCSQAYTITTTHFSELKTLAYMQPGFVNASLDFDEATLSPTYRLRHGVPGSSKATTIAARLGLSRSVVDRAESHLEFGPVELKSVIEGLENKLRQVARKEEELAEAQAGASRLADEARRRLADLEREEEQLRAFYAEQVDKEVKKAQGELRALVARLQKEPSAQRVAKGREELARLEKELGWLKPARPVRETPRVYVGQRVKVLSVNQTGILEAVPEGADEEPDAKVSVLVGALRLKVPLSDLEIVEQPQEEVSPRTVRRPRDTACGGTGRRDKARGGTESSGTGRKRGAADDTVGSGTWRAGQTGDDTERGGALFVRSTANTLDIRGFRVDAALPALERFLDAAALSSIGPLMIIHGHGTGALKAAVREYLDACEYGIRYRPGELREGGDGVTIVDFV